MPLKFVSNKVETTTENATIGAVTTTVSEVPTTQKFIPESVTDYTGSGVATGFSLKFTDGVTYDLDEILFNIRRDNPDSPLAIEVITQDSQREALLAEAVSEILSEYSPPDVYSATISSGSTSVTISSGGDTSLFLEGMRLVKASRVTIGDMWFNESTDTLYTATANYTWTNATEEDYSGLTSEPALTPSVGDMWYDFNEKILHTAAYEGTWESDTEETGIPTEQPESPSIGDRWIAENAVPVSEFGGTVIFTAQPILYTAVSEGTWEGATEVELPITQPDLYPAIGDSWFDKATDTLFTATEAGTWDGATEEVVPTEQPISLESEGSFGPGSRILTVDGPLALTATVQHTESGTIEFRVVLDNIQLVPNSTQLIEQRYLEKTEGLVESEVGSTEEGSLKINSNQPKISVKVADMVKYLTEPASSQVRQAPVVNLNRPLVIWTEGEGDLSLPEDYDDSDGGSFDDEIDGSLFTSETVREEDGGEF